MEFSESIKRALAQSIANRLAHISRVADSGNWRAAAWLLERMAPESFGKNITRELEVGAPRLEKPQGVSIQKLEESIAKILEKRSQQLSNSGRKFIQPKQTGEIRNE